MADEPTAAPTRPTREQAREVQFVNELGRTITLSVERNAESVTIIGTGPDSRVEHTWTPREADHIVALLAGEGTTQPDPKPLAYGQFQERRLPTPADPSPAHVVLHAYKGQDNLHIDGEYAIYRRTDGPRGTASQVPAEVLWEGPAGQLAAALLGKRPSERGWDPNAVVRVVAADGAPQPEADR